MRIVRNPADLQTPNRRILPLAIPASVLFLSAPAWAGMSILQPEQATVSAEGVSVDVDDVYTVNEVIDIQTSTTASCSLYDATGAKVTGFTTKASGSSYWASYAIQGDDPVGTWKLYCQQSGVSDSVTFQVADAHRRLWLQDDGFPSVVDDYVAVGGAKSTYYKSQPAPGAANTNRWVHGVGWYYLQHIALPAASYKFAQKTPTPDNKVQSSATKEPYDELARGDGLGFATVLQRFAVAAQTAREYQDDPGLPYNPIEGLADEYAAAVKYWADYAVDIPDWGTAVLPQTYKSGTGQLVYCGTGSCYTKNSSGAKVAFSGSKTQVKVTLDDLDVSNMLLGLAAAYDWMYEDLDPATRRDWRDKLIVESIRLMNDEGLPRPWGTYQPNALRGISTNSHVWYQHAAIGVVALVLRDEIADETGLEWLEMVDTSFDHAFDSLGRDGGDHNGVAYWEYGMDALLRYVEAVRSIEQDERWYKEAWLMATPKWFMHMTHPNGQRVNLNDSEYADRSTVGYLAARLASQYKWPLGQRIAWQGHNAWAYDTVRRDVLDILWWDESVAPHKDQNTVAEDQCFPDSGFVSARTGWDEDATHIAFQGGPMMGIHDDPSIGSFVLYSRGHLVTSDGNNLESKRTGVHSTLLIDGKGQHGDGLDVTQYPPEDGNDAGLTAYLDNSGGEYDANGEVITWATDLRPMYRYDSGATKYGRPTQVDTSSKKLTSLERHMVWLGHATIVLDRFSGTGSYRVDWNLNTGMNLDADNDGVEDSGEPDTCSVKTGKSGYYQWHDSKNNRVDVAFDNDYLKTCTSSACPSNSTDMSKVNYYQLAPTADTSTAYFCDDGISVASSTGSATIKADSSLGGKMDVVPLDNLGRPWSKQISAYYNGGDIGGYHLNRNVSANAGILAHGLLTYGADGKRAASATAKNATGGLEITVTLPGDDATILAAKGNSTSVTGSGGAVTGAVGVVTRNGSNQVHVAQLVDGTKLVWGGKTLISTSRAANVGLTFEDDAVWGAVQVDASTTIDITVPTLSLSSITGVTLDGKTLAWTKTATGLRVTVSGDGKLVINTSAGTAAGPGSYCAL